MFENTFLPCNSDRCGWWHKSLSSGLNAMLMMQINFISITSANGVTLFRRENFLFSSRRELRLQLNFSHLNCHGCSFPNVNYETRCCCCRCRLKGRSARKFRETKIFFYLRELISRATHEQTIIIEIWLSRPSKIIMCSRRSKFPIRYVKTRMKSWSHSLITSICNSRRSKSKQNMTDRNWLKIWSFGFVFDINLHRWLDKSEGNSK